MIITFCGHSSFYGSSEIEDEIVRIIDEKVNCEPVTFYLGGYGAFDALAKRACLKYKEHNFRAELIFVTPYYSESYFKNREWMLKTFDGILYPFEHERYTKFAIIKRNEWMVNHSDFLIAYVSHGFGGAARTLQYAIKHNKSYKNLGDKVF